MSVRGGDKRREEREKEGENAQVLRLTRVGLTEAKKDINLDTNPVRTK